MTERTSQTDATLPQQLPHANASALIYNGSGEYLPHLRDDIPGIWEPGSWSLLGGGREAGDRSLEETVRRELWEEAGLDIPDLVPFAVEQALGNDGTTVPIHIFAAHWAGDPATLDLTEGVMLRWFRPELVSRLRMTPSTRELVRRHAELLQADSPGIAPPTAAGAATEARRPRTSSALARGGRTALNGIGVHLYVENADGKVLLGLRHPNSAYAASTWHFLAGHCEQESALSCLVREADEEAGLLIEPGDVELAHVVHLVDTPGGQPRMQMVFRARRWSGTPEIREPDKCTRWGWWHPDDLPSQTVPYTRTAIQGIRASRRYTEMGWS
ncbi:NUDIX domain-containing protein [Streptomyces nigrescens]|uniref:NUDIX domain-containing protein n=1 Tax=Streptomyces nigrescens TaxID=1920 RepID=UPI0021C37DDD|nr:NUDIX domain-containing protein [Streptomyces nigrescens]